MLNDIMKHTNYIKIGFYCLFVLVFSLFIFGCSSIYINSNNSSNKHLIRAIPKDLSDYGSVVLFRMLSKDKENNKNQVFKDINVYLNNFIVDKIATNSYKKYKLPPGNYTLYVGSGVVSNTFKFTLSKDETIFLKIGSKVFQGEEVVFFLDEITQEESNNYEDKLDKDQILYSLKKYPLLNIEGYKDSMFFYNPVTEKKVLTRMAKAKVKKN